MKRPPHVPPNAVFTPADTITRTCGGIGSNFEPIWIYRHTNGRTYTAEELFAAGLAVWRIRMGRFQCLDFFPIS